MTGRAHNLYEPLVRGASPLSLLSPASPHKTNGHTIAQKWPNSWSNVVFEEFTFLTIKGGGGNLHRLRQRQTDRQTDRQTGREGQRERE